MLALGLVKNRIIGTLLFLIYSALRLTWRIRIYESDAMKAIKRDNSPVVFAHWHGDIPGVLFLLKPYRAAPIISTSKDGDFVATMAHLFGSKTTRGSSTRGGASALKGMLRLAKQGWRPALAIDGPKGPRHEAKSGIFEISRLLGSPIIPLVAASDRNFVFHKSWDQTKLPKPFARVQIVWSDPLPAVPRETDSRDPDLARELERAMANAERQARDLIAAR